MATRTHASGYHHGDLRQVLLQAAEQLLVAQGIAGLSLRAVARLAGVSHAAPYRHFHNKAALLQALAQSGFERQAAALHAAAVAAPHNPEQKLIEVGLAYVRMAVEQPEITLLMFGGSLESSNDVGQLAADPTRKVLGRIIHEGVRVGVFRDRDVQELALVVWTTIHGLAMLMLAQLPGLDTAGLNDQVRLIIRTLIYGLSK